MQQDLVAEARELQSEMGKQERMATGITNQMHADAQVDGLLCLIVRLVVAHDEYDAH